MPAEPGDGAAASEPAPGPAGCCGSRSHGIISALAALLLALGRTALQNLIYAKSNCIS